jgi:putative transcriptional regulator
MDGSRSLVAPPLTGYLLVMQDDDANDNHLAGMLLVAMPGMPDPRFDRSVIFLCAHSAEGAMGIIVNQIAPNVAFDSIIEQLGIEPTAEAAEIKVHVGGPVESSRGFVLHTADYVHENTLMIDESFALTATVDVLRAIAGGEGPKQKVFALGYAGWAPGQLDAEIQKNGWLIAPPDEQVVFEVDDADKWTAALRKIGVDPSLLSSTAGHA